MVTTIRRNDAKILKDSNNNTTKKFKKKKKKPEEFLNASKHIERTKLRIRTTVVDFLNKILERVIDRRVM